MKIAIIGMGLIGGSLALSLAANGHRVLGVVRNPQHPRYEARPAGVALSANLPDVNQCEVIFICTPLNAVVSTLQELQPHLSAGTTVTDVGSVKCAVCQYAATHMRADCQFVGGHPMAGTEHSGFEHADGALFMGKPWVLMARHALLEALITGIGAKLLFCNPSEHDAAAAVISHLPLLVSRGVLATLNNWPDPVVAALAKEMASSGFAGMTRLARGNAELNRDLACMNHKFITEAYQVFEQIAKSFLQEDQK